LLEKQKVVDLVQDWLFGIMFNQDEGQMDYVVEFEKLLKSAFKAVEYQIDSERIDVIDLGCPHCARTLPRGKMGIYSFALNDRFLKIGKAGSNSGPRFTYQHYKPGSAQSTLASSILSDPEMKKYSLSTDNIESWMKKNLRRIDILFDANFGPLVLSFAETSLHLKYQPKYEGFSSQR